MKTAEEKALRFLMHETNAPEFVSEFDDCPESYHVIAKIMQRYFDQQKEDICKKQKEKVSELDFNSFVNDEAVVWEEFNEEKEEWEYKVSKEFILNAPEPT